MNFNMGFVGLVPFAVKFCVGVLAWPLLSLGYPLCASIRAVENNSVSDTQKLNTYWVVLSLVLLLEHALNLPEWLLWWQYIRLMIVCWLVIPYFDGAFYIYNHLIRPCLSLDLQNVINWFNKRMESLYAKDNFLAEMEKYVKENGPEALEKIIAVKSGGTKVNLDVKDIKAVSSTENKEVEQLMSERPTVTQKDIRPVEVLEKNEVKAAKQLNSERPTITQKDIRPVEVVLEKNEVKAAKQDSGVQPNVTQVENRNFAGPEIKKPVPEVAAQRELPQTPASSKGLKWTCEICHMTFHCVTILDSHLQGKKHKAAIKALKAKNQSSVPKVAYTFIPKNSDVPNVEPGKSGLKKGYPGNAEVRGQQQSNPASIPRESVQAQQPKKPNKESIGINRSSLWCSICNAKCTCESDMASHLGGRRHLSALQQLSTQFEFHI